jgi:hypothetical protein
MFVRRFVNCRTIKLDERNKELLTTTITNIVNKLNKEI